MPSFWAFVLVFIIGIHFPLELTFLSLSTIPAMCLSLDSRYVVPIRSLFTAALYYYRFPSFSMISLLALSGHMFSFPVNGIGYWPSVHKSFYVNLSSRLWIHSIPIPFPVLLSFCYQFTRESYRVAYGVRGLGSFRIRRRDSQILQT